MNEAATEIRAEAAKVGSEINVLIENIEQNNPGATQTLRNLGNAIEEMQSDPNVQELERDAANL